MTPHLRTFQKLFLIVIFFALHTLLPASDHIDGPVTTNHPVADLTGLFAFPCPDKPGHLALIMNVYPGVAASGHFSDKVSYNFLVKHASIAGEGSEMGFTTSGDYSLSCTFETPHEFSAPHWITCKSSNGSTVRIKVDDMSGMKADGNIHVFAGRRSDPFFFNAAWAVAASGGKIGTPKDINIMQDLNALSIVVVIDIEKELGLDKGSLFAVAAETTTADGNVTRQIDRLGRPEITNITMVNNGRKELRDLYNAQKSFDLQGNNVELFRQRLRDNITFYDNLSSTNGWTPETTNQLAEILLNDYLVVDVSKPFSDETYFEIEYALLNGTSNTTCGGRVPNEDIIDVIFTMLINGGKKPTISDGVDGPTKLATNVFPYLATPTDEIAADIKAFIVRSADKLTLSRKHFFIGIMQLLSGLLSLISIVLLVYFFIRQGISRMGYGNYSKKKHTHLIFEVGLLFGLSAIFGLITKSFSYMPLGIFAVASGIAFYFYIKWKREMSK